MECPQVAFGSEVVGELGVPVAAAGIERRVAVQVQADSRGHGVFVRAYVEDVGAADAQGDVVEQGVGDIEVGDPFRSKGAVAALQLLQSLDLAVASGLQVDRQLREFPVGAEDPLGARLGIGEVALTCATDPGQAAAAVVAQALKRPRWLFEVGDDGVVVVEGRVPAHLAQRTSPRAPKSVK